MKYVIFCIIAINLIACKQKSKKIEIPLIDEVKEASIEENNIEKDTISSEKQEVQIITLKEGFSVQVEFYNTFLNTDTPFFPIPFREEYSYKNETDLLVDNDSVSTGDIESDHFKLSEKIAQKYLKTEDTELIEAYDKDQNIIDFLNRESFCYGSAPLETSIGGLYTKVKTDKNPLFVTSFQGKDSLTFKKSPFVYQNSTFSKKMARDNNFDVDKISYNAHFYINDQDIISVVTIEDYPSSRIGTYIFKNDSITDSVTGEFLIEKMIAVPFSDENRYTFLSSCFASDTDFFWDALIAIDPESGKLFFFEENRINP